MTSTTISYLILIVLNTLLPTVLHDKIECDRKDIIIEEKSGFYYIFSFYLLELLNCMIMPFGFYYLSYYRSK